MSRRLVYRIAAVGLGAMMGLAPCLSAGAAELDPAVMGDIPGDVPMPATGELIPYNGQLLTPEQYQVVMQAEQEAREQLEKQQKEQEEFLKEQERLLKEQQEAERKAREEQEKQEKKAREEQEKQEKKAREEQEKQERKAREEQEKQEKKAREDEERKAREKEEEERKFQEEQKRLEEKYRKESGRSAEEEPSSQKDRRSGAASQPDDYETAGKMGYNLQPSKNKISFGTLSADNGLQSERIILSNKSSVGVTLNWVLTDPDNVFDFNSNNVERIPSKDSAMVYVNVDVRKASPGTHYGTLLVGDEGDYGLRWGTTIDLAVTVREEGSVVRGVDITPGYIQATPGSVVLMGSEVWGDNEPSQEVSWSLDGARSRKTAILEDGELQIGSDESANMLKVKATSKQDKRCYGTAQVEIRQNRYTVSTAASPEEGGSVSGADTVDKRGEVKLVASANDGWKFDRWIINGREIEAGNVYTLVAVEENTNVVAKFVRTRINIKVKSENTDYGYVEGGGKIKPGESMTIKATANDGYRFAYWERDGKKYSEESKLKLKDLKKDHKFVAIFEKDKHKVKVVVTPPNAGYVDGEGSYEDEAKVKLKATAAKGYEFKAWMRDGKILGDTSTLTIKGLTKDQNITAAFAPIDAKIEYVEVEAATTTNNGVITPAGKTKIPKGGGLTFTITPRAGFGISGVVIDGNPVGAISSYTFNNVQSNHNIVAAFAPLPGQGDQGRGKKPASQNDDPKGAQDKQPEAKGDKAEKAESHKPAGKGDVLSQITVDKAEDETHFDETEGTTYVEYVRESDSEVSQLAAPMDEMSERTALAGPLQELDILPDEARDMIANHEDQVLMETAISSDVIGVVVNNSYAVNGQESSSNYMYLENPTVRNFEEVVSDIITDEEKLQAYSGERMTVSLNIIDGGTETNTREKEQIRDKLPSDMGVAAFFDMNLLKISRGHITNVERMNREMEVCISIPENLRGRDSYSIARNHNGEVSILTDMDSDPDTITFRTDRFSTYGIVTDMASTTFNFAMIAIICLGVLVIAALILTLTLGLKKKKRKVSAHHED